MGIGAAGAHLGRDPDRFHQLLARGARTQGRLGVALNAIGALRDMRDGDRDELLCLARKGAVREYLLAEGLERDMDVGRKPLADVGQFARRRG